MSAEPKSPGSPVPSPGEATGATAAEARERQAARTRADTRSNVAPGTEASAQLIRFRAHRLFAALADNVRDYAIFLLDTDGIIRYWGEGARLMKWWTREQTEGSHLRMLYPDGGAEDGTAESHITIAAQRGEYTGEGHRVRSDDFTFWAGVTLTALRDEDGVLLGFVKVTRDFTARRAAEAALKAGKKAIEGQQLAEEANRLKTLFVASISHQVRAPLNALLGSVQLLRRDPDRREQQQTHVRRIEQNAKYLLAVVSDLLDHSRMEAGRLAITPSALRLGPVIEAAVADAGSDAAARGVILTNAVSGAAADLPFWGDEIRVRQIIVNLLSNATKYTSGTGAVTTVPVPPTAPPARISPSWAPGFTCALKITARVFPRIGWTRSSSPSSSPRPHTRTAERVLVSRSAGAWRELMGGELTVQSEVGKGSAFVLWLPVANVDEVPR